MQKSDNITHRQLLALYFLSMFSPGIRLLPDAFVLLAGSSAWLSPLLILLPTILYVYMVDRLVCCRREGEGLADLMIRGLGKVGGRIAAVIFAVWLVLYAGFTLRSASERLLSTIYASGNITVFVLTTLLLSALTAAGHIRGLARTAEVLTLVVGAVLILSLAFSVADIKVENLLPVYWSDVPMAALGGVSLLNIASVYLYFQFLAGHVRKNSRRPRKTVLCVMLFIAVIFVLVVTTLGSLSAVVVNSLQNPFFTMIRNVRLLGVAERMEAVVIALWVLTDFIFVAVLISVLKEILCRVGVPFGGKTAVGGCSILIAAVAFLITSSSFSLSELSDTWVPIVNLIFTAILIPATLIIGKLRKRI